MSLFRSLFGLPERREFSLERWQRWLDGGDEVSITGMPVVNADTAKSVAVFYACVKKIAESISTLPCYLMEEKADGSQVEARDHYLYWLHRRGLNPRQTPAGFLKTLTASSAIRGNDYAEIITNARGEVTRVIPFHPDQVEVRLRQDGKIVYWVKPLYGLGPTRVLFEDQVMHFRLLSEDGLMSLSPLEYAKQNLELALAQGIFARKLFSSGAKPSGVLETDHELDDEGRKVLKESWAANAAGLANAQGTPVLDNGVKWRQVSLTAEDAQFLESRKFQNIEICRLFSMPPHLVGELDRATNNNIEQQAKEFLTQCIRPWLVEREQTYDQYLLSDRERGRYFHRFDTEQLERGDTKTEWETANIGVQGGILNQDEARERLGYNPLPNGAGKIYRVPLNMEPAGKTKDKDSNQRGLEDKVNQLIQVVERLSNDRQNSVELPSIQVQDSVRNLTKGLLFDVYERILKKESSILEDKVQRLKPKEFTEWVARFYVDHNSYMVKQLTPLYRRIFESVGILAEDLDELAASRSRAIAGEHCARSRQALEQSIGAAIDNRHQDEGVSWKLFITELTGVTAQWRGRIQEAVDSEMQSIESLLEG